MIEVLIVACIIWALGIPIFMLSFKELIKDDPHASDMLSMNSLGLILLSAAIVCWPVILLLKVVNKR